jgi:hypothetical protein
MRALVLKREADANSVVGVAVNDAAAEFSFADEFLRVRLPIPSGAKVTVRVSYRKRSKRISGRTSAAHTVKVAAKRYLSEFRDNYLARNAFLSRCACRLRQFVK